MVHVSCTTCVHTCMYVVHVRFVHVVHVGLTVVPVCNVVHMYTSYNDIQNCSMSCTVCTPGTYGMCT